MNRITGTLIWYYYVCPREVWLIARELNPFQEDNFLEVGEIFQISSTFQDTTHIFTDSKNRE